MNLNLFIAGRIGKKTLSNGKLSKISNVIASLSVGISVAIMILAIAISNGFRNEVREKASGFNGDILVILTPCGVDVEDHTDHGAGLGHGNAIFQRNELIIFYFA